ncbi:MAG: CoA transferase, partial [Gammaproteobacteria bacterium HGW-Gammaproteobacteria-5]
MNESTLHGLRVVSLGSGIASAAAGLQLYEAGAEVFLVEPPDNPARREEALFAVLNRGKRSVTLDINVPDGQQRLERLLAAADVLIHEFTPKQAATLGLDDAQLAQRFPALIVSAITGWPKKHPLAGAVPRETLVLARLGLLDEQPGHRPGPVFVRMPFANWLASWLCVVGVMARLIARDRDGRGGAAHTSLAQ